jgi:hypothetical protein
MMSRANTPMMTARTAEAQYSPDAMIASNYSQGVSCLQSSGEADLISLKIAMLGVRGAK